MDLNDGVYGQFSNQDVEGDGEARVNEWDQMLNTPAGWEPDPTANPHNRSCLDTYTIAIRNLVDECIRFDPDARPTFPELLQLIRQQRDLYNGGLCTEPSNGEGLNDTNRLYFDQNQLLTGQPLAQVAVAYADQKKQQPRPIPAAPPANAYVAGDDLEMGGIAGADLEM